MEKIQTAIQELISELQALKQTKVLMPSLNAIDDCINLAYAKLEAEKIQIIDAITQYEIKYNKIYSEQGILNVVNKAEQYYKETFKSE